jgi:cysteine desulfurase
MLDIHLDHAVKHHINPEVLQTLLSLLPKKLKKKESYSLMKKGLSTLYQLIQAHESDHMIFVSSQAEAINHLIWSTYLDVTRKTGKNHFVTSIIDEAPQIMAMSRLQDVGAIFEMAPVNHEGFVTPQSIAETLTPRTALVSLSYANGLTGVIQPVEEIAALCKERGIYVHVDLSLGLLGKKFSFKDSLFDFVTINGEAIGGPPATALLFIRKEINLSPFILGGNEQGGLRGGSYSMAAFLSLVKAFEIVEENRDFFALECSRLRGHFEELIMAKMQRCLPFFQKSGRVPQICAIDFPKVSNDALLFLLHKKQLFATQGGGNFQKISLILKASSFSSHSALSFSFSRFSNEEMIEDAVNRIEESYNFLKKASCHL